MQSSFLKNIFLLPLLLLGFSGISYAQLVLEGKVSDEQGESLFGATIFVHELGKGTITEVDGAYRLENLKRGTYHLHVTYMGFESQTRTVMLKKPLTELNFELIASPLEMKEMVVESDPFKSGPLEQSMTIETVNRDFLEKNAGNTFVNSLEKIPGVTSVNTGVGISKPVIRGMTGSRVIVVDRGVKQEGQQWGSDHGLEIDQFAPERVEVIKGPASLLYGSDGIAGVINILPPVLPTGGEWEGELKSVYKSNNHLVANSLMAEGSYKDFGIRLRVSAQDFGDYRVPAENFTYQSYKFPIENGKLKNTAGNERNITFMSGVKKDWGQATLTVSNFHQKAGLFPGATGLPKSYQLADDGDSRNIDVPRQVNNHLKVIGNFKVLLRSNWLEAEVGYQNNLRKEETRPHGSGQIPAEFGNSALGLELQTISGNVKYFQQLNEKHKRITGMQMQYQMHQRDGFEFLLSDFTAFQAGAFWYEEISLGNQFSINAGARADFGRTQVDEYLHPYYEEEQLAMYLAKVKDIDRKFVSMSGAAGLSFYPTHTFNAKLNLGSSFRFPTPAELSMNGLHHGTFRYERGDSTLQAERGWQADLNMSWHDEKLHINVTPYFNYFDNFLYLAPTSQFASSGAPGSEAFQLYQYKQNKAIFTGLEASAEYHLLDELHVGASYEYVWNYNLETYLPLPMTPPYSLKADIEYEMPLQNNWFSDLTLTVNGQYTGAQNRVDRNERPTEGYMLMNASVSVKIRLLSQPFIWQVNVQNLTDQKYMNHLSRYRMLNLPEQGRNFNISLKVPFSKEG